MNCICNKAQSSIFQSLFIIVCTCQYLHTECGNMHVLIQERRRPCKNIWTVSHSCYGNVCYVMLWQNEQNINETNKQALVRRKQKWIKCVDLLWWDPKLFVLLHDAEKMDWTDWDVYLLACLIFFLTNLRLCCLHVWSLWICNEQLLRYSIIKGETPRFQCELSNNS